MAINAGSIYSELVLKSDKYFAGLRNADKATKDFEGRMKSMTSGAGAMSQKLGGMSKTFGDISQVAGKVGRGLTTGVTLPIVGIATAASMVGIAFKDEMAKVQAISGATGKEFDDLGNLAKELGSKTKFSATEVASGMKFMSMAGWSATQTMKALPAVLNLAVASGEDLASTSDIVTDAITSFGLEAEDATKFTDILASTATNSNVSVSGLGESFKYVAPLAGALGHSAEDTSFALGLMADSGIKGSIAGSALRGALTNLTKPTKAMQGEMTRLGISMLDSNGEVKQGKELYDHLREKIGKLPKAQQAASAATIFGKEAMSGLLAVINASDEDYNDLYNNIENSSGAAQKMADIMSDTAGGALTSMKSALEGAGIALYESLEPHIVNVANKVQSLASWFSKLDSSTMNTIVTVGALAAGIGPLIWGFAKVAGVASTVFGVLSTVSGAVGIVTGATVVATPAMTALAGAFTFLTGPVGLAIAGFGLVAGALGFVVNDLRKDAIPEVDRFGEGVSDATKKAVGGFLDLEEKASVSLKQLAWSGQVVTKKTADDIKGNFDGMASQVVQEFNVQKDESLLALKKMFDGTTSMTDEEKNKILETTTQKFDKQIGIVNSGNEKIKEITDLALKENRALTEQELNQINFIKGEMTKTAVKIMSDGEQEQLAIMESLRAESGKISALQAAEVVKNSVTQKNATIKEANEEYKERLKAAAMLREEGGVEANAMADKIVAEAKRQRDESVNKATEMHEGVVTEAKLQAKEHVNEVDWETGEILSRWEQFTSSLSGIFERADKWMTQKVTGMVKWFGSKWDQMHNDTTGKFEITWSDVMNSWKPFDEFMTRNVSKFTKWISDKWRNMHSDTKGSWELTSSDVMKIWTPFDEWMTRNITGFFDRFRKKTKDTHTENKGSWELSTKDIKNIWIPFDKFMTNNITGFFDKFRKETDKSNKANAKSWEITGQDVKNTWKKVQSALGLTQEDIIRTTTKNNKRESNQSKKHMAEMLSDLDTWTRKWMIKKDDWWARISNTDTRNRAREKKQSQDNMNEMYRDLNAWIQRWMTAKDNWWSRNLAKGRENNQKEKSQSYNNAKDIYNDAMNWASKQFSGLSNWWRKQTEQRRTQDAIDKRESAAKWKTIKDDAVDKAKQTYEGMKKWWDLGLKVAKTSINGVIKGANFVLGALGVSKASQITPYEKGTQGHKGGHALVNDQKGSTYEEIVELPNGEAFIPKGRNVFIPHMPIGTKVLPAEQTKDVMRYEKGVGQGMFAKATKVKDEIKDKVKDIGKAFDIFSWIEKPLELAKKVITDNVNYGDASGLPLKIGKGIVSKSTSHLGDFIKGKFEGITGEEGFAGGIGGMGSSIIGQPGFRGFRKTSPFGYRRHPIYGIGRLHAGVDLAAPTGTPVYAQNPGRVSFSGRAGGYGNLVKIAFGNMENRYAHLSQAIARTGSIVARGQLIGKVGSTGASTGPHLHFEKRINGRAVHPGYATGTNNARKGWNWVGEEGPELMNFKGGETVLSNRESLNVMDQVKRFSVKREDIATPTNSFNVESVNQGNNTKDQTEIDYEKLSTTLIKALESADIRASTYLNNKLVSDEISSELAMKQVRRR